MMLVGFGGMGAVLRRNRRQAADGLRLNASHRTVKQGSPALARGFSLRHVRNG